MFRSEIVFHFDDVALRAAFFENTRFPIWTSGETTGLLVCPWFGLLWVCVVCPWCVRGFGLLCVCPWCVRWR